MAAELEANVLEAATCGNLDSVLMWCESYELSGAADGDAAAEASSAALHILANLAVGDLNNARFVWKRTPEAAKKRSDELQAVWEMGTALWKRDTPSFFVAASAFSWSPAVEALTEATVSAVRERQATLLGKAYTTIGADFVATKLGLPDAASAAAFAVERGWKDEGDGMLAPPPATVDVAAGVGPQQLQHLTDYVIHQERRVDAVDSDPALAAVISEAAGGAGEGGRGGGASSTRASAAADAPMGGGAPPM